tara:strand:- start:1649 stop:2788 length:1140 start_codon:yes stop_codon:yes gene_type:complete
VPELGNTNFEPVPFGGTNPGFPEPPHELQKDINEMLLVYTTPIFNPKMSRVGKATLDPAKVKIAQTQWFSGGGGFIESMTTNFEDNNGCAVNALVIANVRKYCKELKKHPKLKNKSCEEIILILTQELYDRYNLEIKNVPGEPLRSREVPGHGVSMHDKMQYLLPAKRRMMKMYGVYPKKKRIFGISPPTGLPLPGIPEPPDPLDGPGWGEEEIEMLPPNIQAWHHGGGWTPTGGGGQGPRPPENSPYGASACCPPPPPYGEGCEVVVGYRSPRGHEREPAPGNYHSVAGKIIKCKPLTIECEEHALQNENMQYTLTIYPPNPFQSATALTPGTHSAGGVVEATLNPTSPMFTAALANMDIPSPLWDEELEIVSIICLC